MGSSDILSTAILADGGREKDEKKTGKTCTVIFDTGSGEPAESVPGVKSGALICPPPLPEKGGSVFGGWYKDTFCTECWHFDRDTVSADTRLYARWFTATEANAFFLTRTDCDGYAFSFAQSASYADFVIPAQLGNKNITRIADFAAEQAALKGSVTIPGFIESIGNSAFENQTRLTRVILERGVAAIGECAFKRCYSLESISMPDSVAAIGDSAFSGCAALTGIAIPDGMQILCANTFYSCTSLTAVRIGNGVRHIGDTVFQNCLELNDVSLGDSLESIGIRAFQNCEKLTTIILPDSLTSIGQEAFGYCRSLTNVRIPKSVTTVGADPFLQCISLKQNIFTPNKTQFNKG